MSGKVLIPRGDHEVYFIALPKGMTRRRRGPFVADALRERHPCFSVSTAFDAQKIVCNGKPWIMATVMEHEKLAGYRVDHPGAAFFTATGVLVRRKDFAGRGMRVLPGETVGYDRDGDRPVSVPSEDRSGAADDAAGLTELVKKTPKRYGVFGKKRRPVWYALAAAAAMLAAAVFGTRQYRAGTAGREAGTVAAPVTEEAATPEYMPGPFVLLAETADGIAEEGGVILRWHYDESAAAALVIQVAGADAEKTYAVVDGKRYAGDSDLSEIRYVEGKPVYTITVFPDAAAYRAPPLRSFSGPREVLPALAALREGLRPLGAEMAAEIPPSQYNGNGVCAVEMAADAEAVVRALETAEDLFNEKGLRVYGADVSFDGETGMFRVYCSFAPYREDGCLPAVMGERKGSIPKAFGYRGKKAAAVKPPPAAGVREPEAPPRKIGVIRDDGQGSLVYYRNGDGKIYTREE